MKNLLLITMLLGVGYSQCYESNWQTYYPNMEGCELEGANLEGADLSFADLSGANLSYANLIEADLSWANLDQAYLNGANLEGANLTGAFLMGANLEWTNLCNLTGSPGGGVCEDPEGTTDWDGDGYDDVSYQVGFSEGFSEGAASVNVGDANGDGTLNVIDLVVFVDLIINP